MEKLISKTTIMEYLKDERLREHVDGHKDDFAVKDKMGMINSFINFVVYSEGAESKIIKAINKEIRYSKRFYYNSEYEYRQGLLKAIEIITKGDWNDEY